MTTPARTKWLLLTGLTAVACTPQPSGTDQHRQGTPSQTAQAPSATAAVPSATATTAAPAATLQIVLEAQPATKLTVAQLQQFQLNFQVTNTGSSVIDPGLGRSVLLLDGRPAPDWDITINNGPRDERWNALPPNDTLKFGYAFRDRLFDRPGSYTLQLKVGSVRSAVLTVEVVP